MSVCFVFRHQPGSSGKVARRKDDHIQRFEILGCLIAIDDEMVYAYSRRNSH
jgi:hypothetical protein